MASIKTFIVALIDAIIFSNTWISIGALSLYFSAHVLINRPVNYYGSVAVFTSTFIAYNFLKINGAKYESNTSIFFDWIRKHKAFIYFLMIMNAFYFLYSFAFLELWQQINFFVAAIISAVYFGINRFNLRKYWLLKIPIVALVWSIIIVFTFVPFQIDQEIIALAIFVFVLIAGLTIPFEIRDYKTDTESLQHQTLVGKVGLKSTKYLAMLHIVVAYLILFYFSIPIIYLSPLFMLALWGVYNINFQSAEYFYTLFLDGVLVFLFPLLYIVS